MIYFISLYLSLIHICSLMERPDVTELVNACDAGREGELIFRLVYEAAGSSKPCLLYTSIAPSSFHFGETRTFRIGEMYGAVSFLQITAREIHDRILAEFMETEMCIRDSREDWEIIEGCHEAIVTPEEWEPVSYTHLTRPCCSSCRS